MVFETEEAVINVILEELSSREHSISSLWRQLSEEEGMKMHRLELTGYLKAMTEMGLLKEKARPPSKYYTVSGHTMSNIYDEVGTKCDQLKMKEGDKGTCALYLLHRIFRRPILLEEMRMAGYPHDTFAGKKVPKNKTVDSLKLVRKMGLNPPRNDPGFLPEDEFPEYEGIFIDILVEKMGIQKGVKGTRQVTLGKF